MTPEQRQRRELFRMGFALALQHVAGHLSEQAKRALLEEIADEWFHTHMLGVTHAQWARERDK